MYLLRDLQEYLVERVALALPALAADRDVEAVRVLDRPGRKAHDQAFGRNFIADMVEREGGKHRLQRVAVLQDGHRLVVMGKGGKVRCR